MSKKLFFPVFLFASMIVSIQAYAGDTTELIDHGTLEIDPTLSLTNIHDGKPGFSSELSLGYGVTDFLTTSIAFTQSSAEALADSDLAVTLGFLSTPLDSDFFDIDVMLDFSLEGLGAGPASYAVTPGLEFNFDLDPDMSSWGLYLRLGLPIHSEHIIDLKSDDESLKTDLDLEFTLGTYLSFGDIHQILIEGGFTAANLAENLGERDVLDPFLSLGYNVQILDTFELTSELAFDIPKNDDDDFSATLSIGGIFSIQTQ